MESISKESPVCMQNLRRNAKECRSECKHVMAIIDNQL